MSENSGTGSRALRAAPSRRMLGFVPVYYQCQRCTACCRWPGQVRLSPEEITRLAAFLNLTEFDFIQRYTRLAGDRRGLALEEKEGGDCIFLEGNDCLVQAVKPQQCRDFPNHWNFRGFQMICRAVPKEVTEEEYERLMAAGDSRNPAELTAA